MTPAEQLAATKPGFYERPDRPGLWHREGKNYRVWKRDDGSFGAEHIDANGMIGAYYGNDLPTGNWQPLVAPVTLSEAREQPDSAGVWQRESDRIYRIWEWPKGAWLHQRIDLRDGAMHPCREPLASGNWRRIDQAAELFGRVEQAEIDLDAIERELVRECERAMAQRDEFLLSGKKSTAANGGSHDTCFGAILRKHFGKSDQIADLKATIARLEGEVAALNPPDDGDAADEAFFASVLKRVEAMGCVIYTGKTSADHLQFAVAPSTPDGNWLLSLKFTRMVGENRQTTFVPLMENPTRGQVRRLLEVLK